jgi:hypothetical protein
MKKQITGLEIELAIAFNGPWDFEGHLTEGQFTLDQLRAAKWIHLTKAEQAYYIQGVRSILRTLNDKPNFKLLFDKYMEKTGG